MVSLFESLQTTDLLVMLVGSGLSISNNPIPRRAQSQVGWDPGQLDLVGGNQPMAGDGNWIIIEIPSNPSLSMIL